MSLTFFIITIFLMISNLIWMIFFTPMVPNQQWAQKIFYLHVPIAWSGFLAYFIVMLNGIFYLYTKNLKYDRIGLAFGQPQKHEDDTVDPFLYELYYDYKLNDSVSITPAVFGGTSKNSSGTKVDMSGYVVNTTLKF